MLDYVTALGLLSYSKGLHCKSMKNSLLFNQNFPNCIYSPPIKKNWTTSAIKLVVFL